MTTCAALSGADRTSEVVEVHTFCTSGGVEILRSSDKVLFSVSVRSSRHASHWNTIKLNHSRFKITKYTENNEHYCLMRSVLRPAAPSGSPSTERLSSPRPPFPLHLVFTLPPHSCSQIQQERTSSIFLLHRDPAAVSECVRRAAGGGGGGGDNRQ